MLTFVTTPIPRGGCAQQTQDRVSIRVRGAPDGRGVVLVQVSAQRPGPRIDDDVTLEGFFDDVTSPLQRAVMLVKQEAVDQGIRA